MCGPGISRKGFTLIELLIVIGIIAILALIAIPNFIEAQTRGKVSRAMADLRSLAVGVEAYCVDWNIVPPPAVEEGDIASGGEEEEEDDGGLFETRTPRVLTTPVAYMATLPTEPFSGPGDLESPLCHYSTHPWISKMGRDNTEREKLDDQWGDYILATTFKENPAVVYTLLSHGPDMDHDVSPDHREEGEQGNLEEEYRYEGNAALYDPTNGAISSGDIVYFGPGVGFLR